MTPYPDTQSPALAPGATLCSIPGCGRLTMRSEGKGHAEFHCRYHVQFKARHGSHWCPTYLPRDYRPYEMAARDWLEANLDDPYVAITLANLRGLLNNGREAVPAFRLRGLPPKDRAAIAFARLRKAHVEPLRLAAIELGVNALIEDDKGSHRAREFRIVQVAKALHRLASGSHSEAKKYFEGRNPLKFKFDFYPKSSGLVLRVMGEAMERACEFITDEAVPKVIASKHAVSGLHESYRPGWEPLWRRKLEAARLKALG